MSKNKETADNPVEKADSNQFTPKVYTDSVTKEYSGGTPKQNHKTNELKEKAEAKASFTYAGPSSYAGPASASSLPHESSSTYAGPASITNLPHESSEMNDGGDDDQSSSTSREFTTIFSRDSPPASSDDTNFYARISNILDDETPQLLPSFSWVYNNWASSTYAGTSSYTGPASAGPASASSLPHESSSTYAGPASISNLPHESSEMNDGGDDDQSSSTSREFTTIFSRDSPPASSDDTNFYARISNILDDETPQPLPSFSWVYNNWDNNNLTLPPLNHPLQSNASGLDAIEPNSQPTGPGSPF